MFLYKGDYNLPGVYRGFITSVGYGADYTTGKQGYLYV